MFCYDAKENHLVKARRAGMKRIIQIILIFALCAAVLTGCGGGGNGSSSGSPKSEKASVTSESALQSEAASNLSSAGAVTKAAVGRDVTTSTIAGTDSANPEKGKPEGASSQKLDQYQTASVPAGKPAPVEPQNKEVDKKKTLHCTLSISCTTILDHMDRFDQAKLEVLPKDGIIYKTKKIVFYEGENVFDVLLRETRENKIHMEFVDTPIYNSNYIEGINNIYEFDCGELSGWMYKVNGWFPNYGCSRYQLQDGDNIEWVYTCDLGKDVGEDGNMQKGAKEQTQ
jgi:hypothetical protein